MRGCDSGELTLLTRVANVLLLVPVQLVSVSAFSGPDGEDESCTIGNRAI